MRDVQMTRSFCQRLLPLVTALVDERGCAYERGVENDEKDRIDEVWPTGANDARRRHAWELCGSEKSAR